jgi:hypothetical protein
MDRSQVVLSRTHLAVFCLLSIVLSCGTDYNVVAVLDQEAMGGTGSVKRPTHDGGSAGNVQQGPAMGGSNYGEKTGSTSAAGGRIAAGGSPVDGNNETGPNPTNGGSQGFAGASASSQVQGGNDSYSSTSLAPITSGENNSVLIWNGNEALSNKLCFCTPPGAPLLCDDQGEFVYPDCTENCLTRFPACIGSCSCEAPLFGDVILGNSIDCSTHADCSSGSICLVTLDAATFEPLAARCF